MSDSPQHASPGSLKGEVSLSEPTRHERTVARRSAEIRATVPHAEFTRVVSMDAACGAASAGGFDPIGLVLAAVARALVEVPALNGAYRDGHAERYSRVNLGAVIAADGVYAVPTMFDCDEKSAGHLASEYADLRERALSDRLIPAELTGATFTVTDLGPDGIHASGPLVIGGQAGAVSMGATRVVPILDGDTVRAGRESVLTLSVDHRVIQAPAAGRFLTAVARGLESA
ncbi:MAG TPA: 2-oxo acid dehydrogenase subunit E2 [Solirubrobacteraceae bacterium]|nr:2-oxo acid dehydrogenase subunit E2 [Solirubrobacteraceae bacterium]